MKIFLKKTPNKHKKKELKINHLKKQKINSHVKSTLKDIWNKKLEMLCNKKKKLNYLKKMNPLNFLLFLSILFQRKNFHFQLFSGDRISIEKFPLVDFIFRHQHPLFMTLLSCFQFLWWRLNSLSTTATVHWGKKTFLLWNSWVISIIKSSSLFMLR